MVHIFTILSHLCCIQLNSYQKNKPMYLNKILKYCKEKLYYLEDVLPSKDFIRISNSAIININHVKCFNTSIIGKIIVKFKDGNEESVSKRRTSEIMKFLKDRSE